MCCYVLLCVVMCCYVLLCVVMCCYVLLCVVMCCYVLLLHGICLSRKCGILDVYYRSSQYNADVMVILFYSFLGKTKQVACYSNLFQFFGYSVLSSDWVACLAGYSCLWENRG